MQNPENQILVAQFSHKVVHFVPFTWLLIKNRLKFIFYLDIIAALIGAEGQLQILFYFWLAGLI